MPLYMDSHYVAPATARDALEVHNKDLRTQDFYGVRYLRYWIAEEEGKVFCLVDAPNAEVVANVHRVAHGLETDEIYLVEEGT